MILYASWIYNCLYFVGIVATITDILNYEYFLCIFITFFHLSNLSCSAHVHIWMKSRNKGISSVVEDYEEPINNFNPMASLLGKKDNASKKCKKDQKSRENLQLNKSDKENEEPFHLMENKKFRRKI